MKVQGYAAETRRASKLLMAPLQALLAAGAADGTFPLADPAADAPLIQSAVWAAAGLALMGDTTPSRAEAAPTRPFLLRAARLGSRARGLCEHTGEAASERERVPLAST